jgi:hypothetical protein
MSAVDPIWAARRIADPIGWSDRWADQLLKNVMVFPGLRSLILLAALALPAVPPAFAQANNDAKPADQQKPADPKKAEADKWASELAEAAKMLPGPAAKPECLWLGKRVINLLYRDDMDTAFRHIDIYDRFGCPGAHIQASFSCLVRQAPLDGKSTDQIDERVKTCWLNPGGAPATAAATNAPPAPAPAAGTNPR